MIWPLQLRDKTNHDAFNMMIQENRNAHTYNEQKSMSASQALVTITKENLKRSVSKSDVYIEDLKNEYIYGYIIKLEKSELQEENTLKNKSTFGGGMTSNNIGYLLKSKKDDNFKRQSKLGKNKDEPGSSYNSKII